MERLARFIYRRFKLIIIFVAILNIVSLASFFRFGLDTDFLSLFTRGNPRAEEYDRLNEKYRIGEALSVLIEREDSLLEEENLQAVYRVQQRIEGIDGIYRVQSFIPDELSIGGRMVDDVGDFIAKHPDLMKDFIEDEYFLADQFLSDDRSKGSMLATLEFNARAGEVVAALNELVEEERHLTLSLAGNEIIKDTLWHYLLRIIFILPPCAIVLVLLIFYLMLRNRTFTVLSVIPAGLSVLWVFGTIFWSGQKLNLVTVISPIFVLVGVDYSIHLISGIYYFRKQGLGREESVEAALRSVSRPVLTNAFGLAIGLSVLFFSPLRIHLQAASVMWVAMTVSSLAALLLIPIFYTGMRVVREEE